MIAGTDDVQAELLSGETLLWSGKPKPGFTLRAYDILLIPMGVLFLALPILVTWGSTSDVRTPGSTPPTFVFLFFTPFIAIGAYFAFGHLLWERTARAHSNYALTERRVIIMRRWIRTSIKSIALDEIHDVGVSVGRDGVGTIAFNEFKNVWNPYAYGGMWFYQPTPGFELIADARDVYRLIGEARARLKQ